MKQFDLDKVRNSINRYIVDINPAGKMAVKAVDTYWMNKNECVARIEGENQNLMGIALDTKELIDKLSSQYSKVEWNDFYFFKNLSGRFCSYIKITL